MCRRGDVFICICCDHLVDYDSINNKHVNVIFLTNFQKRIQIEITDIMSQTTQIPWCNFIIMKNELVSLCLWQLLNHCRHTHKKYRSNQHQLFFHAKNQKFKRDSKNETNKKHILVVATIVGFGNWLSLCDFSPLFFTSPMIALNLK